MNMEPGKEYLLWDGDCGFCRRCSQLLARWDTTGFVFAPYQVFSEAQLKRVGLNYHRCGRELKVITRTGRSFGGAFAVNYFFWQQPRLRPLVLLGFLFPLLFLLEVLVYKIIADNRLLFSKILFPGK